MKESSKGADALRRAGFIKLPRWWVTVDQYEVIERMAYGNKEEVYRIKNEARDDEYPEHDPA